MPFCPVVSSFFSVKLRKMGLTKEEAYEILELPNNSPYETVLKSYKRLSLHWFPDKHDFSPTALENFQKISLAVMKLSFPERKICSQLTQTDMFLVFHQVFFGGEKCIYQEQGVDVEEIPSHEENIVKQKKKEKRKAERKRKKERRKLEKELEQQKKDDRAAAVSPSTKNHKRKKKGNKEVANSDVCKICFHDSTCDCDDCLDDHSNIESDDMAKKYNQLLHDPYFSNRSEYDHYFRNDWDFGDECDYSGTDSSYSDCDEYPGGRDFFNDLFGKLKREALKDVAAVSKLADKNASDLIAEEEKKKKQAERRKKQKQKRKEKKKVEKAESEEGKSDKQNSSLTEMSNNNKSSESEENIDLSSAFVVAVAKKKKMINQQKVENLFQNSSEQRNCSSQAEVAEEDVPHCESINLAIRGNEMALIGNYEVAVKLFTEAITVDTFNYRYYGNRSYCYERLGQYANALKDAEEAIDFFPKWAKGHFRKGKALVGMKKYSEAEMAFKEVLLLDPECKDVRTEIFIARVLHIMEKGFSRERAEAAVRQSEDVESALNLLLSEDFSEIDLDEDVDLFVSDDNDDARENFVLPETKTVKIKCITSVAPSARKTLQTPKIFVGHVPESCKAKDLQSLFENHGKVKECDIVGGHAFVHMGTPEEAERAIKTLNNITFKGSRLSVVHSTSKFHPQPGAPGRAMGNAAPRSTTTKLHIEPTVPARGQNNAVKSVPRDECYFWRTTGCINPESCRFKHIKQNKGIDKKTSRLKNS